jgi:hypothetical protein
MAGKIKPSEQFRLLAWLMDNPDKITTSPFNSMLLFARQNFTEPRAAWLARALVIHQCDMTSLPRFASQQGQSEWFGKFLKETAKDGYAFVPPEIEIQL